ncbi:MAG: hypothetical protein KGL39_48495 [Patescibacteria group bacterium]|nr:hypothetical protein [Patescibacteria group bacterium]
MNALAEINREINSTEVERLKRENDRLRQLLEILRAPALLLMSLMCANVHGQVISNVEFSPVGTNTARLTWANNTNVSLYVVVESPILSLPLTLWNGVGAVTNLPPSTNATLSFTIQTTNAYPDFQPPLYYDFYALLAWTNGVPRETLITNWYALQMVQHSDLDSQGRVVGWGREGHWFSITNTDAIPPLAPMGQMPGVTNNNPNFNILHF